MAYLKISSEGIAQLGVSLGNIADYLEVRAYYTRDGSQEDYGFPTITGAGALDSVLGDYELIRIAMCTRLRGLRDLASDAGACYVQAEDIADPRQRRVR